MSKWLLIDMEGRTTRREGVRNPAYGPLAFHHVMHPAEGCIVFHCQVQAQSLVGTLSAKSQTERESET